MHFTCVACNSNFKDLSKKYTGKNEIRFMCRHGITCQLQMLNKLLYIYTKKNHIIYLDQKSSEKKTRSLTTLLVISACESLDAFAITPQ